MRTLLLTAVLLGSSAAATRADENDAGTEVRRVLDERRAELCRCVERGVDSGRLIPVLFRFDITPKGRAANLEIEVSDDIPVSVAKCLKRTVERLRFPEATFYSTVEHKMSFLNSRKDRPQLGRMERARR
jgi:hypothetical protein